MKRVGLFFGGPSNEHEVSLVSAANVAKNIDHKKFKVVYIYWDKTGRFSIVSAVDKLKKRLDVAIEDFGKYIDLALLMTHGRYGEDGVLQAILENRHIPYTGCHVLSSAICMDKAIFRNLIFGHKIPQAKYVAIDYILEGQQDIINKIKEAEELLRLPVFVKPANSGSSVGISKVKEWGCLARAIKEARKHDSKIIIEQGFIGCREVEVAVLGNSELIISPAGELEVVGDFYDYDEKYKLGRTKVKIPATISEKATAKIRELAEQVYRMCGCNGFARIDFFVRGDNVFISEINTLPGFTDISMYPMLMMKTGLSYSELISKIIGLAY